MEDEDGNSRDETIQKYLFSRAERRYKEKELSVYGIGIKKLKFQLQGKFKYPITN